MQNQIKSKEKLFTSSKIAKAAIFTALSFILYAFIKFPLPIFPNFLEVNFSDVPALIGSFILGPIYGAIIILLKVVLKLPFTTTACVGEFADLLIGLAFIVPASIIYQKKKNIKGACIGLAVGSILSIIIATVSNRFILIPFFKAAWGFEAIISVCEIIFKNINSGNFYYYYILFAVIPFNILRCLVAVILTFLLYKRISHLFNKF